MDVVVHGGEVAASGCRLPPSPALPPRPSPPRHPVCSVLSLSLTSLAMRRGLSIPNRTHTRTHS